MESIEKHFNNMISSIAPHKLFKNNLTLQELKIFVSDNGHLDMYSFNKVGELKPYDFLLNLCVAYNSVYFQKLTEECKTKPLGFNTNNKQEYTLTAILLFRQSLHCLITTRHLLFSNLDYQSLQSLRPFIESSTLLYLILTDEEFYDKYKSDNKDKQEYMKHWWKSLKPAAVLKTIKQNKERLKDPIYSIARSRNNFFESEFFVNLYETTSDYIHFKHNTLTRMAHNDLNKGFFISVGFEKFSSKKQYLVNLIEISINLLKRIEEVISSQISIWNNGDEYYETIGLMVDFLYLQSVINGDLYQFSKE